MTAPPDATSATAAPPAPPDLLDDLLAYLDASPSPWHAVASTTRRLVNAGWQIVSETDAWGPELARRGLVVRGGALVAWRVPVDAPAHAPVRLVGAHTDSPCLRVKPRPDVGHLGWKQLAVEVYGGILANSWLDRDLGVAGRLVLRDTSTVDVSVLEPVARVPQLAIHLDREINERGLLLDKQQHLTPVWGTGTAAPGEFTRWIATRAGVEPEAIATWELCLTDTTPAAVLGADRSLLASGRLDNQLSCWAATTALTSGVAGGGTVDVIALFDHEEVGSESATGAAGPLLESVLERLVVARGGSRDDLHRSLAASTCVSADNAHAVHPNYPERHEPGHRPVVGGGPAVKVNANQRYATSAETAATFQQACDAAGVPWQVFVSRNNMPCGSTIGPITATRLGIATVDVGVPQLSMHSARELCGVADPLYLVAALRSWFARS
jgi:aspartyl aminopeptidase